MLVLRHSLLMLPALILVAACSGAGSPTLPPVPSRDPAATPGAGDPVLEMTAKGIAYAALTLEVLAGQSFSIRFRNNDPTSIPHDIDIRLEDGSTVVQDMPTINGGKETTYHFAPLPAGTYQFVCSVHPVPAMTGTLTAK
jgi:plastocyanin